MTPERILLVLRRLGWIPVNVWPTTVLFHIGLVAGFLLAGQWVDGRYDRSLTAELDAPVGVTAFEHPIDPTDPRGFGVLEPTPAGRSDLVISWVGGSPLSLGPSDGPWDSLPIEVSAALSSITRRSVQVHVFQLQASGLGDLSVASKVALEVKPDLLVFEANAVWFGNDLVTTRYPYLEGALSESLLGAPRLYPMAVALRSPGEAMLALVGLVSPEAASFVSTPEVVRSVESRLDLIDADETRRAETPVEAPGAGLDSYWFVGRQDFGLFWDQVGVRWRGRMSDTGGRLRDGSEIADALFLELVESVTGAGVPMYAYVNPVDVDDELVPFVRQKEFNLLGLDNDKASAMFTTPSQFLNGRFPEMTFRDPNHVDLPGGMVEFLADDLCAALVDTGLFDGRCPS